MNSPLGLDLTRRFAHEHSDRMIHTDADVLRPMASALQHALGPKAHIIGQDIANAFADTTLFSIPRGASTSLSVSKTMARLAESATDTEAENVVRFGSILLLGTISLAYNPNDLSTNKYARRQEAYSSAAREAIRRIASSESAVIARAFDKACLQSAGYVLASAEGLAPAFLELAEQAEPVPHPISSASADIASAVEIETNNALCLEQGTELESDVMDEIADCISALPWATTSVEGGSLEIAALRELGKTIAYVVDATNVHAKLAGINKHARLIHSRLVDKNVILAARRCLDFNTRTLNAQSITLSSHSTHGTNERTIRTYMLRVPVVTSEGLPVLAIAGVSRTKESQGQLLRVLLADDSISTHDAMG